MPATWSAVRKRRSKLNSVNKADKKNIKKNRLVGGEGLKHEKKGYVIFSNGPAHKNN